MSRGAVPAERGERNLAFDVLRVAAVYLTFVSHTYLFHRDIFSIGRWSFPFAAPAWACMWVLYTLSGYLAGRRFANKSNRSLNEAFRYYYSKLMRIWVPAILFVLAISVLVYPDFLPGNPTVLWSFLFLTYRGSPGPDGISDLWFAFTVMVLYALAPLVCALAQKLPRRALLLLAVLCLLLGLAYRLYARSQALVYMTAVYLPVYGQLDFFFSGILMSCYAAGRAEAERPKGAYGRIVKLTAALCVIAVFFFGFLSVWNAVARGDGRLYDGLYSFVGPTLFSGATLFFLFAFDSAASAGMRPVRKTVGFLAKYGFEFYLFHSLVLARISPYINAGSALARHFKLLASAFAVSLALSVMFHSVTSALAKKADFDYRDVFHVDRYWVYCLSLYASVVVALAAVYFILI